MDCQNIVNPIKTFINVEACLEFLKKIENEKICMIISGSLAQDIVPQIHNMSQVDTIFIFCGNKKLHELWIKDWSKIKGVFTEIDSICEALKVAAQHCEQNATPISFMPTSSDISTKNLNQLDPSFMYTQILKDILLIIDFDEQHITQFIQYCRDVYEDNRKELNNVNELEDKYYNKTPIWWYTSESFLYPMLNRALRTLDSDIIIKLGFFISDLHRQIEQLYQEQFKCTDSSETLTLYRGQSLSQIEFQRMKETKGGLISFNCFLSTSESRQISLHFANHALANPDLVGTLFVITVDSHQSTTPFASVANVGRFRDKEKEILFSMHTVLRIGEITSIEENSQLYQVNLTLTTDNDEDFVALTNRIREEAEGTTDWDQLGELLLKMGQPAKAQQVYEILREEATTEIEKARIYHQLGRVKDDLGDYHEALRLYETALSLQKRLLCSTHSDLAKTYNSIGLAYYSLGEYWKALSSHEKALKIKQQSLSPNHPDLAKSYNNIGVTYCNIGEYAQALLSYEKSLEIRHQSLPSAHPDLAASYNNIGFVYSQMGEYSKTVPFYERALEIGQQSLPPNHPSLKLYKTNLYVVNKKL